jgi:hypothetical protein
MIVGQASLLLNTSQALHEIAVLKLVVRASLQCKLNCEEHLLDWKATVDFVVGVNLYKVGCNSLDCLGVAIKVAQDRGDFLDKHHLRHVQASVEAVDDLEILQDCFQRCCADY